MGAGQNALNASHRLPSQPELVDEFPERIKHKRYVSEDAQCVPEMEARERNVKVNGDSGASNGEVRFTVGSVEKEHELSQSPRHRHRHPPLHRVSRGHIAADVMGDGSVDGNAVGGGGGSVDGNAVGVGVGGGGAGGARRESAHRKKCTQKDAYETDVNPEHKYTLSGPNSSLHSFF